MEFFHNPIRSCLLQKRVSLVSLKPLHFVVSTFLLFLASLGKMQIEVSSFCKQKDFNSIIKQHSKKIFVNYMGIIGAVMFLIRIICLQLLHWKDQAGSWYHQGFGRLPLLYMIFFSFFDNFGEIQFPWLDVFVCL